jgi:acyl-CoA dehydrogenase
VGLARWALERTVRFVADDGSLASDAAVRRLLADAAIDIHAARRMSIGTVQLMDAGRAAGMERAMTRTHVVEMCGRVYERCMQIHGGSGLTNDAGFFDGWHQVRIVLSALGPGDPLRARIADCLSQGDLAL